jgi:tripeptide aminopeptidase
MDFTNYKHTVTERFIRYAKIDTQSDPNSYNYPEYHETKKSW